MSHGHLSEEVFEANVIDGVMGFVRRTTVGVAEDQKPQVLLDRLAEYEQQLVPKSKK